MKEYAKAFYKSQAWKKCRREYVKAAAGLCEMCLAEGIYTPGVIVHHKKHVTPETITDPSVLLSFDNLMLVCREHHAKLHEKDIPKASIHKKIKRRYSIDDLGRVIINEEVDSL